MRLRVGEGKGSLFHKTLRPMKTYEEQIFSGKPLYDVKLVKDDEVEYTYEDKVKAGNPKAVADFLRKGFFGGSTVEKMVLVLLDTSMHIIGAVKISEGSINQSVIEPRKIFQAAILSNAHSILLAHNHPSGNPEPSRADVEVTEDVKEAGDVMGIELVDHVIVTDDTHTSLVSEMLM